MTAGEAPRVPLAVAQRIADELVDLLGDACERLVVAGSVRRGRPEVGDVELVSVPRTAERLEAVDLFGSRAVLVDLLTDRCRELLAAGVLAHRPDKNGRPSFGERAKRLSYRGVAVDLFSVIPPAQWGVILLIRTGPAEFGRLLVLRQSDGGWLPRGFFFRDGQLWRLPPPFDASAHQRAVPVPTPGEGDVFAALGYRWVAPELRGDRRPPRLEATAGGDG
jgi:DNA polymerase/3'-5' exonuclease PolX